MPAEKSFLFFFHLSFCFSLSERRILLSVRFPVPGLPFTFCICMCSTIKWLFLSLPSLSCPSEASMVVVYLLLLLRASGTQTAVELSQIQSEHLFKAPSSVPLHILGAASEWLCCLGLLKPAHESRVWPMQIRRRASLTP